MMNPADLTHENIQKLAEKMRDPQARMQAAHKLASTIGPSPDEQDQIQAQFGNAMQPQQQGQMPQQEQPLPSANMPQGPTPAATQQQQEKQYGAQMYDQLGLTGAQPGDVWGKAAIFFEFQQGQQAAQQQQQQQAMMAQQQGGMPPQGGGGAPPQIPTEPVRATSPQKNVQNYMQAGGQ